VPLSNCAFLFPFTSLLPFKVAFCLQAVGLRGYAQRDPLVEYKLEGYNLFLEMMANIRRNTIYNVYMFQPAKVTLFIFSLSFCTLQSDPVWPHALSIRFATVVYICCSLHFKHLQLKHNFSRGCALKVVLSQVYVSTSRQALILGCQRSAVAGLLECTSLCRRCCCTLRVQGHTDYVTPAV